MTTTTIILRDYRNETLEPSKPPTEQADLHRSWWHRPDGRRSRDFLHAAGTCAKLTDGRYYR